MAYFRGDSDSLQDLIKGLLDSKYCSWGWGHLGHRSQMDGTTFLLE